MSIDNDLFGYIPKTLPRLPRLGGCAADRRTPAERSAFLLAASNLAEKHEARRPILEARKKIKELQVRVHLFIAERAEIKSRAKAAREKREAITLTINDLRAEITKLKPAALLK